MGSVDVNVHNFIKGEKPVEVEVEEFIKDVHGGTDFVTLRLRASDGSQVTFFLPDKLAVLDIAVAMINLVNKPEV